MILKDWRIALVLVLVGVGLGGCYEDDRYRYLAHGDCVTLGAGNANAVNAATMAIDPWPPESKDNRIDKDGKRAAHRGEALRDQYQHQAEGRQHELCLVE